MARRTTANQTIGSRDIVGPPFELRLHSGRITVAVGSLGFHGPGQLALPGAVAEGSRTGGASCNRHLGDRIA